MVTELGLDLGLSRALMFRVMAFARASPKRPKPELSWSQYTTLLSLRDDATRGQYEVLARTEKLTHRALKHAVARRTLSTSGADTASALPRPTGADHVYAVEVPRVLDGDTLEVATE